MGRRSSLVIGAILVAGGAGVATYGATRPAAKSVSGTNQAATVAAAALEKRLATASADLDARATKLAALRPVQSAVATDVATTANLSYADLTFEPREREIVELGQSKKAGGAVQSLAVLPATAPRSRHLGDAGLFASSTGADLALTKVVHVTPADHQDELAGWLAVTMTYDVGADLAALRAGGARVDTLDGKLVIGTDPGTGTQLPIQAVPGVTLVVPAPMASSGGGGLGWLVWPGAGAAAVGALLLMIAMMRRSAPVASTATPPPVEAPGASLPSTQISQPRATSTRTDPAATGATFGRYQLMKKLGSGGMAEVFLARSHGEAGFAKLVALKLLHGHLASRPQVMAHFLDEARLASNLNHPNIVQIFDLGKVDNDFYIAMEYVEGSDLERLIHVGRTQGRHVPMPIAMTILRRICDGLDAAHRAFGPDGTPLHIVHRDVKSGNVMVSRQGQVKIGDFGIAKGTSQVHTTQIGETKGTPSVMAPEQRMGQEVDLRADVYSVAALGYELFTSAEMNLDLVQLAQLGIDGWPHLPPPSGVRTDLPRELDAVLLGALAFSAESRPASCHDLEEQLARIANHYGLTATDKEIARWVEGELAQMPQPVDGGQVMPPVSAGA